MLFHLEIGNAIAKQPAQAVVLLEHRHGMTGAGELLGAGKPRRTGTDDGNPLAAPALGRLRLVGSPGSYKTSVASLAMRSEEHTSELQSLMRISYAVFCLKKKKKKHHNTT